MKFALGTVQFGLDYGIQGNGKPNEEKVFDMLATAINKGVDILDTAAAYGEAEMIIGRFLRTCPEFECKFNVVSKLKPNAFENISPDQWAGCAKRSAEESIKRLGINKLFAYLFHNAEYIFNYDAVKALGSVHTSGLAEHIGVSVYSPEEAMKALEYPEISAIQIPYNLFDRRLDKCGFFEKALSQNVLVFARSSLLQGLVVMDPNNLPDKVAFAQRYLRQLRTLCQQNDISILKTAIGYVGNKKGIDYVVFGVDNKTQLNEYLELQDTILSKEMVYNIDNLFDNVEERLVNPVLWR